LPLEIAHVPGHTSTGRAPRRHPESLPATLGIIAESRRWVPGGARGSKGPFAWQRSLLSR
jgi:hypothetical protein